MHGYKALEGFGITRNKNQRVANKEIRTYTIFAGTFIFVKNRVVLCIQSGSFWSLSSVIIIFITFILSYYFINSNFVKS